MFFSSFFFWRECVCVCVLSSTERGRDLQTDPVGARRGGEEWSCCAGGAGGIVAVLAQLRVLLWKQRLQVCAT